MDGYQTSGNWQKLVCTETPAAITRQPGSNIVTLILDPDHPENFPDFKKATITLNSQLGLSVYSLSMFFFVFKTSLSLRITLQMLQKVILRSRTLINLSTKAYAQTGPATVLFSTSSITLLKIGLALCVPFLDLLIDACTDIIIFWGSVHA
jgi:hypothetical protein